LSSASRVCSVISNLTGRPVFFWQTVPRSTACPGGGNVLDLEADEIATPELAIDGKIEHGEVACSPVVNLGIRGN